MDTKIVSLIDEIVDFIVKNEILVTAFDVTSNVKEVLRKSGEFVPATHRHIHLKDYVHDSFNRYVSNSLYSKTLCNLTINESAFVFHPNYVSPSCYTIDSFSYEDELNKSKQCSTQSTVVDEKKKVYIQKPDSRGTVCVPASLLREIGLKPSDCAYVYFDNGVLKVSPQKPQNTENSVYTVDDSNNVRITQFTLNKYSYLFKNYKFDVQNSIVRLMAS